MPEPLDVPHVKRLAVGGARAGELVARLDLDFFGFLEDLEHDRGERVAAERRARHRLAQGVAVVHGGHGGAPRAAVHHQRGGAPGGERREHRSLGQEHRRRVVFLEHQRHHLLASFARDVHGLAEQNRVLVRLHHQSLAQRVFPDGFHGVPIAHVAVLVERASQIDVVAAERRVVHVVVARLRRVVVDPGRLRLLPLSLLLRVFFLLLLLLLRLLAARLRALFRLGLLHLDVAEPILRDPADGGREHRLRGVLARVPRLHRVRPHVHHDRGDLICRVRGKGGRGKREGRVSGPVSDGTRVFERGGDRAGDATRRGTATATARRSDGKERRPRHPAHRRETPKDARAVGSDVPPPYMTPADQSRPLRVDFLARFPRRILAKRF